MQKEITGKIKFIVFDYFSKLATGDEFIIFNSDETKYVKAGNRIAINQETKGIEKFDPDCMVKTV